MANLKVYEGSEKLEAQPGWLFLTRNTAEVGNDTPGYWNHAAMMSINGWVVEAQSQPNAVIAVPFDRFVARYPEIACLYATDGRSYNTLMAHKILGWLGQPYNKLESYFPYWKGGENCVSLVRKCFIEITGEDPGWRKPDHLLRTWHKPQWHKNDYENWEKPPKWFSGMTTDANVVIMDPMRTVVQRPQDMGGGTFSLWSSKDIREWGDQDLPDGWFCFDGEYFKTYASQKEAQGAAETALAEWREMARTDEWPDEAERVCWGRIMEQAAVTHEEPLPSKNGVFQEMGLIPARRYE